MKRLLTFLILSCLLLTSCGQKSETSVTADVPAWQQQYDLGVRYLSEGNYEEAIIAFTAAIEIDSKQAEVYLALAESYIAMNDFENAAKVLEQGLTATGDKSLQVRLDEINSRNITDHLGITRKESCYDGEGNLLAYYIYSYADGKRSRVTRYGPSGELLAHIDELYDQEGRPLQQMWLKDTGGGMMAYKVNTYDERGNLAVSESFWEDGSLYPIKNKYLAYDAQGNCTESCQYALNEELGEYELDCRTLSTYDEKGRLLIMHDYDAKTNFLRSSFENQYDQSGNKVKDIQTDYSDEQEGQGEYIIERRYYWDEQRRLTKQEYYDYSSDDHHNLTKPADGLTMYITYEYEGEKVTSRQYDGKGTLQHVSVG